MIEILIHFEKLQRASEKLKSKFAINRDEDILFRKLSCSTNRKPLGGQVCDTIEECVSFDMHRTFPVCYLNVAGAECEVGERAKQKAGAPLAPFRGAEFCCCRDFFIGLATFADIHLT